MYFGFLSTSSSEKWLINLKVNENESLYYASSDPHLITMHEIVIFAQEL